MSLSTPDKPKQEVGERRGLSAWFDDPVEVIAAIVLSVAGLLTAWSGYQAALWDGEQAAHYTEANAARVEASRASSQGMEFAVIDMQMFTSWLNAYAMSNEDLQAFYRARFRPEFKPAFEAWMATRPRQPGTPPTPFAMPEYRMAELVRARELEAKANALFDQGERANDISDAFVRATVGLASAMFFGGIAQVFKLSRVRLALVGVALICCVFGVVKVLELPMAS